MLRLSLIALLLLAGCQEQPQPGRWSDYLDPYMAERGYTMSSDGETILKNGYAVWIDPICYGRACFSNRALVPTELAQSVREDFLDALEESKAEYVTDVSDKIGIKPSKPAPEVTK